MEWKHAIKTWGNIQGHPKPDKILRKCHSTKWDRYDPYGWWRYCQSQRTGKLYVRRASGIWGRKLRYGTEPGGEQCLHRNLWFRWEHWWGSDRKAYRQGRVCTCRRRHGWTCCKCTGTANWRSRPDWYKRIPANREQGTRNLWEKICISASSDWYQSHRLYDPYRTWTARTDHWWPSDR